MTDAAVKWHKSDLENRMYLVLEGGKKIAMPRYFKDKIYTEEERKRIAFFAQIMNEQREAEELAARIREYGDDHVRVKVEADKHEFAKMYRKAVQGRNKV